MRVPPERRVKTPEFGLYRTLEGWAIWAVFPTGFSPFPQPYLSAATIEFNNWCAERGIVFDIIRVSEQYWNSERGAIVSDESLAVEFKLRWVTHRVEFG